MSSASLTAVGGEHRYQLASYCISGGPPDAWWTGAESYGVSCEVWCLVASARCCAVADPVCSCYSNGSLTVIFTPISVSNSLYFFFCCLVSGLLRHAVTDATPAPHLRLQLNSKNILKSQTHSATITVVETPTRASNARVALVGTMEIFFEIDATLRDELADCYTAVHPDAKRWIPGTVNAHPVRPSERLNSFKSSTLS